VDYFTPITTAASTLFTGAVGTVVGAQVSGHIKNKQSRHEQVAPNIAKTLRLSEQLNDLWVDLGRARGLFPVPPRQPEPDEIISRASALLRKMTYAVDTLEMYAHQIIAGYARTIRHGHLRMLDLLDDPAERVSAFQFERQIALMKSLQDHFKNAVRRVGA
jgi:hypothetical protein